MDGKKQGNLRKLIRGILKAFQALLNYSTKAISVNYERQESTSHVHLPPTVVSISNFPPEVSEYYRSKVKAKPHPKAWRYTKRFFEVVGILTALGIAWLTYCTLRQVRRQADATQGQLDIMRATQIPWVGLASGVSITNPPTFRALENGVNFGQQLT